MKPYLTRRPASPVLKLDTTVFYVKSGGSARLVHDWWTTPLLLLLLLIDTLYTHGGEGLSRHRTKRRLTHSPGVNQMTSFIYVWSCYFYTRTNRLEEGLKSPLSMAVEKSEFHARTSFANNNVFVPHGEKCIQNLLRFIWIQCCVYRHAFTGARARTHTHSVKAKLEQQTFPVAGSVKVLRHNLLFFTTLTNFFALSISSSHAHAYSHTYTHLLG